MEKFKDFLVRLQNLPEIQKKIVLWSIVGVFAVIMGYFWVVGTINNVQKISQSVGQIKLPNIQTPQMPAINILQTTTPSNK